MDIVCNAKTGCVKLASGWYCHQLKKESQAMEIFVLGFTAVSLLVVIYQFRSYFASQGK